MMWSAMLVVLRAAWIAAGSEDLARLIASAAISTASKANAALRSNRSPVSLSKRSAISRARLFCGLYQGTHDI